MMRNEYGSIGHRGRYPDGRKRRWTCAEKSAVKRARAEELLSIARSWRREASSETQTDEVKSTTPTRGGVGKWVEELPWELWELILDNPSAVDCLNCMTATKLMIGRYEGESDLAELREEARDELQAAREKLYARRIKAAVDYYLMYNIQLRQPGVSYKYVAKRFKIEKPELKEEIWDSSRSVLRQ